MSGVEAQGLDAVIVRFEGADARVRAALRQAIEIETTEEVAIIKEKLSGPLLKTRTGRLRRSVHSSVTDTESAITGVVGTDVEYAKFLEDGSGPHVIEPKTARALRFVIGGNVIFAKRVNHPGTRAYQMFKGTLRERESIIRERLALAAATAMGERP